MILQNIDLAFVFGFFAISLLIGILTSRRAGKSFKDFFLSGQNMPWWLLGVSMVATTFSSDTPNLVADIVRQNGISGNWVWWAFCLRACLLCLFMQNYGAGQKCSQIWNFTNSATAAKKQHFYVDSGLYTLVCSST